MRLKSFNNSYESIRKKLNLYCQSERHYYANDRRRHGIATSQFPSILVRSTQSSLHGKETQNASFLLLLLPTPALPHPKTLILFSSSLMSITYALIVVIATKYVKVVKVIKEVGITW